MSKFQIVGIPVGKITIGDRRWCSTCQQWTIHQRPPNALFTVWECTVCRCIAKEDE